MTHEASVAASSVVVALDVGGTGIKCAIVDPNGQVRLSARYATGRERGPDAVVTSLIDHAAQLVQRARAAGHTPVAVGVVVPGVVDEAAGVARWSANLGLRDVALRELMTSRLGLPTRIGHDVRAGALAEARLGAGRAAARMLFVAIGTGIAGGYVVDGRVDPGAHGAAGEIGHVAVRFGAQAPPCGCGARGCLESIASAAAIARTYAARQATGSGVDAAEVARRAAAGDADAAAVWQDAVSALADGLLAAIALYDPELVVLGGGLAEAGAALLEPLGAALANRRTFHQLPRLARAELGEGAGCLGAALLALEAVRS
jgi:glucokinase